MLRRPTLDVCSFLRKPVLKQFFGLPRSFSSSTTNQEETFGEEHKLRYRRPSCPGAVEDVEGYQIGGFHPLSIGDVLCDSRYQVLHKLGFNSFSTVWLARDRCPLEGSSPQGHLVAVKVLAADRTSQPWAGTSEMIVPTILGAMPNDDRPLPIRKNIQRYEEFFTADSPNGSHFCIVSALAGPSVLAVSAILNKSNRKLRSDLTRRLAQQITSVIEQAHSSGVISGDISTSNIRFSPVDDIRTWSDSELYAKLGHPQSEDVITIDGSPPGPSAPTSLVKVIDPSHFISHSLLQENVMVTDFRVPFGMNKSGWIYPLGTALHYEPLENHFDSTIDLPSDIWMLACTLFEIRAGYSLFDRFARNRSLAWKGIVELLGKFPDPWWSRFESRRCWFEENGEPRPKNAQRMAGLVHLACRSSIRQKLREIGDTDQAGRSQSGVESSLSEPKTSRMAKEEVELFADLLEKMLRYEPSERIAIDEVAHHPWFRYDL